jgi:hypothetical protein
MEAERVLVWHFLPSDGRLQYGIRRKVKAGSTYSCKGPLVLCRNGMHASERARDALRYAPGPILCRVELSGEILREPNKLCARRRKVLAMADATPLLHEFACWCAENALRTARVDDRRCWAAIETKRRWLKGEATDKEVEAARYEAHGAGSYVTWVAAASDAASEAASEAATAAASAEAWNAGLNAGWDAGWNADWNADWNVWWDAWSAASDAQNSYLEDKVRELLGVDV